MLRMTVLCVNEKQLVKTVTLGLYNLGFSVLSATSFDTTDYNSLDSLTMFNESDIVISEGAADAPDALLCLAPRVVVRTSSFFCSVL